MLLFKALIPAITLTLLAFIARHYYAQIPQGLSHALLYLPLLLFVLITAIGIYFNQIQVILAVILLSFLYLAVEFNWLNSALHMALFGTLAPVLILLSQMLKKHSIASIRALPIYALYALGFVFAWWIIEHQPTWATEYLLAQWFGTSGFLWSTFPQTALIFYLLAGIGLLVQIIKHSDGQSVAAFMLLLSTYLLLQTPNSTEQMLIFTTILLLYLLVVLQKSRHMAYIDELTRLPARRALVEKMQSLLGVYSIAMVDIDLFKKFNDTYGHDVGDDVLKLIATQLNKVAGGGHVYRFGGEEFTVVFTNKCTQQCLPYLEQLRQNIADTPVSIAPKKAAKKSQQQSTVNLTVSIGVADSIGINSANEVMKNADIALYKAKKKGRNRVIC